MLKIEIADTQEKQSKGLMFKKSLEKDQGMLFKFNEPKYLSFWGLNTYIPLDIAFVDKFGKISNIEKIEPHSLKSVNSNSKCIFAIEANVNYFKENNVDIGDFVEIENSIVKFNKKSNKFAQILKDNIPELSREDIADTLEEGKDEEKVKEELSKTDDVSIDKVDKTDKTDNVDNINKLYKTEIDKQNNEVPSEIREYPKFNNIIEAIKWAEYNREVIKINYLTDSGFTLVREVEPHGNYFAKTTRRSILVTFDQTASSIKSFIIRNIKEYTFVGRKFNKRFIFKG